MHEGGCGSCPRGPANGDRQSPHRRHSQVFIAAGARRPEQKREPGLSVQRGCSCFVNGAVSARRRLTAPCSPTEQSGPSADGCSVSRLRKPGLWALGSVGLVTLHGPACAGRRIWRVTGGGAGESDRRLSGRGGITNSVCGFPRMAARLSTLGCMGVGSYDRKQHEPMNETVLVGAELRPR
jgi:hypothetical protein